MPSYTTLNGKLIGHNSHFDHAGRRCPRCVEQFLAYRQSFGKAGINLKIRRPLANAEREKGLIKFVQIPVQDSSPVLRFECGSGVDRLQDCTSSQNQLL